jgi:hypothetical protein
VGFFGIEFAQSLTGLKNYRDNWASFGRSVGIFGSSWFSSIMSWNEYEKIRETIKIDFEKV